MSLRTRDYLLIAKPVLLVAILFTIGNGCTGVDRNNLHPEISDSDIKNGRLLANTYCQSCHALPDPSMLDSKTWEKGVLPMMGPHLGIFSWNGVRYPSSRNDMNLVRGYYPKEPVLKPEEWQKIINYFIATAPDTLLNEKPGQPGIQSNLTLFTSKVPATASTTPATTFVKILGGNKSGELIASDAVRNKLYRYDNHLNAIDSVSASGPVVDVEIDSSNWLTCNIGVLNPNNGSYGSGKKANLLSNNKLKADSLPLFAGLQRPVQISSADLNNDGRTDYLVCEFGFLTGALSWMENLGNDKFSRHVLRPLPGAIKAYINDYSNDGLPDLWVLFCQGREGVFLYTNKGQGKFEEKQVLGFPSVNGSSYFELIDFNKDGHADIVYTCGDNADYSTILKPYHGVYIFLNDGKNNFSQQYFFHINGCYKALARDFDNDGDLDIATIAFFADYIHTPEEGFVYLENKGDMKFLPYSLTQTEQGRWLTMDAGDFNNDGRLDIILGNFSIGPSKIKSTFDWKKGPSYMLLKNTGKK